MSRIIMQTEILITSKQFTDKSLYSVHFCGFFVQAHLLLLQIFMHYCCALYKLWHYNFRPSITSRLIHFPPPHKNRLKTYVLKAKFTFDKEQKVISHCSWSGIKYMRAQTLIFRSIYFLVFKHSKQFSIVSVITFFYINTQNPYRNSIYIFTIKKTILHIKHYILVINL